MMASKVSKPLAFELVAKDAFKAAIPLAKPQLQEPLMAVTVITPDEYVGKVIGDLNRRRAMILNQTNDNGRIVIEAEVPLSTMFGYISQLRGLSAGRAVFSMQFDRFATVSTGVQAEILDAVLV